MHSIVQRIHTFGGKLARDCYLRWYFLLLWFPYQICGFMFQKSQNTAAAQNPLNMWLIVLSVSLWNNILSNRNWWILFFLLQNLELIRITSYKRSVSNATPSCEEWVIGVMLSLYFTHFIVFLKDFVHVNSKSLLLLFFKYYWLKCSTFRKGKSPGNASLLLFFHSQRLINVRNVWHIFLNAGQIQSFQF
jgi:hypothetical protein